jgi:hypothetical protein
MVIICIIAIDGSMADTLFLIPPQLHFVKRWVQPRKKK